MTFDADNETARIGGDIAGLVAELGIEKEFAEAKAESEKRRFRVITARAARVFRAFRRRAALIINPE